MVPVAPVKEFRLRCGPATHIAIQVSFPNPHDALRFGKRQRAEYYGVNYAEDCRVRANPDRQCQHCNDSEARASPQHSPPKTQVLPKYFHRQHTSSCSVQSRNGVVYHLYQYLQGTFASVAHTLCPTKTPNDSTCGRVLVFAMPRLAEMRTEGRCL